MKRFNRIASVCIFTGLLAGAFVTSGCGGVDNVDTIDFFASFTDGAGKAIPTGTAVIHVAWITDGQIGSTNDIASIANRQFNIEDGTVAAAVAAPMGATINKDDFTVKTCVADVTDDQGVEYKGVVGHCSFGGYHKSSDGWSDSFTISGTFQLPASSSPSQPPAGAPNGGNGPSAMRQLFQHRDGAGPASVFDRNGVSRPDRQLRDSDSSGSAGSARS